MRGTTPRLAGLAVAAMVFSGCGGSPEPQPLPKPTASTSPSVSASSPPAIPEAAKANTRAGAINFVRHYVEVLNYATFTGDTKLARALDAGKCKSCGRMLASIETIYAAGGTVEGGAWKPSPVSDVAHPDGKGWTVDMKISYGPQRVTPQEGDKSRRYTGGSRLTSFILNATKGGGWKVTEWTRAS